MESHKYGQNNLSEGRVSIAIQSMTRKVIAREQMRSGLTQEQAAQTIARRIREAPGTLMNIIKKRAKRIDSAFRDKITDYAIRQLETEMKGLEHELTLARKCGADPREDRMDEIENLLSKARGLLSEGS